MELHARFKETALKVQALAKKLPNHLGLRLYALYKQATEGDVHGEKPASFDMHALAKYNSWEDLKGTPQEEAMQQYCTLAESLLQQKHKF